MRLFFNIRTYYIGPLPLYPFAFGMSVQDLNHVKGISRSKSRDMRVQDQNDVI